LKYNSTLVIQDCAGDTPQSMGENNMHILVIEDCPGDSPQILGDNNMSTFVIEDCTQPIEALSTGDISPASTLIIREV
jgi:hypothetical protein